MILLALLDFAFVTIIYLLLFFHLFSEYGFVIFIWVNYEIYIFVIWIIYSKVKVYSYLLVHIKSLNSQVHNHMLFD